MTSNSEDFGFEDIHIACSLTTFTLLVIIFLIVVIVFVTIIITAWFVVYEAVGLITGFQK